MKLKFFEKQVADLAAKAKGDAEKFSKSVTEMLDGDDVIDTDGEAIDVKSYVDTVVARDFGDDGDDDTSKIGFDSDAIAKLYSDAVQKGVEMATKAIEAKAKTREKGTLEGGVDEEGFEYEIKGANIRVVGAVRERDPMKGWRSKGHFLQTVAKFYRNPNGLSDKDIDMLGGKAILGGSQSVGADGGLLVPPGVVAGIWDGMNRDAVDNMLSRCDQVSVPQQSITIKANAETSRANGSRWGGVTAQWMSEGGTVDESKPTFRDLKVEPHKLGATYYATDEILENAPMLEAYATRAFASELEFKVNDAIVRGDGAGKPKGILNSACTVSVAKETGQGAATVVAQNIIKMWAALHVRSKANAVWYINTEVEAQLMQMTLGSGVGNLLVYMPPGGLSSAPYGTLLGRPVVPVEYCEAVGTVGDIILADLSAYVVGTKGGITSAVSSHVQFLTDQMTYKFRTKIDGQPYLASAITPYKGSGTRSPFITLANRA